jgi:1-acyl-sn-glycerol-3-phosphate acyltransferase
MEAHRDSAYPRALVRRLVTIPTLFVALVLTVTLSPLLALVAGAVDGLRADRGWPSVRLLGFLLAYLGYETAGVLRAGWIWLSQPLARDSWTDRNHRLQIWWVRNLARAGGPILGLRLEVETVGPPSPGPLIVAGRHVSLVDALLPALVLGVGEDLRLRYVLTRGLQLDPCLDIVGHRLPNHFIDRSGSDSTAEIAAVGRLGADLGPRDAVVIFPEGGLFTPARREGALDHLARTGSDRVETARALQNVLLPRRGGISALLRAAPDADVMVVAHHGFEPLGSLTALWRALPLTEPVRLRVERYPRAGVPAAGDGPIRWLDDRWVTMDRWLATIAASGHETGSAGEVRP